VLKSRLDRVLGPSLKVDIYPSITEMQRVIIPDGDEDGATTTLRLVRMLRRYGNRLLLTENSGAGICLVFSICNALGHPQTRFPDLFDWMETNDWGQLIVELPRLGFQATGSGVLRSLVGYNQTAQGTIRLNSLSYRQGLNLFWLGDLDFSASWAHALDVTERHFAWTPVPGSVQDPVKNMFIGSKTKPRAETVSHLIRMHYIRARFVVPHLLILHNDGDDH